MCQISRRYQKKIIILHNHHYRLHKYCNEFSPFQLASTSVSPHLSSTTEDFELTGMSPLILHPNHRLRRIRMVLLWILLDDAGGAVSSCGAALPHRSLAGGGLDVELVGLAGRVLLRVTVWFGQAVSAELCWTGEGAGDNWAEHALLFSFFCVRAGVWIDSRPSVRGRLC